jgi:polyisoprenoid-binding protein YceI
MTLPFLALAATLAPSLALASPVTFSLDPEQTELVALLHPAGFLAGAAHPHVIAAREVTGEVVYDADDPARSSVRVELPAASLSNDEPALRRKYELPGTLGEADRRKVAETMRSRDQLDVEDHPTLAFASRSVTPLADGQLRIVGLLAIRGVEARVELPVKVSVEDGVLRGEGTLRITHGMFGFRPFSTGAGTIRNADEIVLRIKLVGRRKAAPPGTATGPASP